MKVFKRGQRLTRALWFCTWRERHGSGCGDAGEHMARTSAASHRRRLGAGCWWVLAWAVMVRRAGVADADGVGWLPVQLLGVEQHPVMIEPRAHSALFMSFGRPDAIDALLPGMPDWPPGPISRSAHDALSAQDALSAPQSRVRGAAQGEVPEVVAAQVGLQEVGPFFQPQGVVSGGASLRGKRCHRCHMRRAVRGHFNAHKQWTTLLCRVCVDALGQDARRTTLLLNARCSECTRVAAFGPAHGSNRLVLPSSEPQRRNRTLTLRSVPVHCKEHRAEGEVDVKHPRCNWPGPPAAGDPRGPSPSQAPSALTHPPRSSCTRQVRHVCRRVCTIGDTTIGDTTIGDTRSINRLLASILL